VRHGLCSRDADIEKEGGANEETPEILSSRFLADSGCSKRRRKEENPTQLKLFPMRKGGKAGELVTKADIFFSLP